MEPRPLWHPHVHCVVAGGGLREDGTFAATSPRFLFPVRVLGRLFRGKLLAALDRLHREDRLTVPGTSDPEAWPALRQRLYAKDWVVYCKPPFAGPDAVYAYLGRYTHRIGLSNRRLLNVTEERVTFATRHGKRASLAPRVFLRRFLEHVLPPGFVRIRHYGLLASAHVHAGLARARVALEPAPASQPATEGETEPDAEADDDELLVETVRRLGGLDLRRCPERAHRAMQLGAAPLPRGPPC